MAIEIKKILCPTDFSENSEHALEYAMTLAVLTRAELQLFHVVEPVVYPQSTELFEPQLNEVELTMQMEQAYRQQLDDRVAALRAKYDDVAGQLATGHPFVEIVQAARLDGADLIVMGTHGRSGLAHILIGSVAEKVVREAPCPVLTVKNPEHEFIQP